MLTQNRVIKVETCSIHICFGHTYKYSVQVYLLACLVDLDGPAVLCWVKLSFLPQNWLHYVLSTNHTPADSSAKLIFLVILA